MFPHNCADTSSGNPQTNYRGVLLFLLLLCSAMNCEVHLLGNMDRKMEAVPKAPLDTSMRPLTAIPKEPTNTCAALLS